ncbi:MAG: hypothetical protein WCH44_10090 [Betaproteobacteria bacterium]
MAAQRSAFLAKLAGPPHPCSFAIWEIGTSVNPAWLRLRSRIHCVAF